MHKLKNLFVYWPLFVLIAGSACSNEPTSTRRNPPQQDTTDTNEPPVDADTDVNLWLTTADKTALFEKQDVSLQFSNSSGSGRAITVDTSQTFQSMDGFGFALTGGSAVVIYNLPESQRSDLLNELFGTDSTNIGISYLRVSIGASDLSKRVFSYDEIADGETDEDLSEFDLGPDLYNVVPLLKEILSINPDIKILGSPWSAPVWMKTNNSSIGGSLQPKYYDVYAQYFVKYIQAMANNGIKISAITPQNEPQNPANNPSMKMTAEEQNTFIKNYLGPAFESAGMDTKIIVYDHNANRPDYPITILSNSKTRKYVAGSAFHLYRGNISALSQVHDKFPNENIYFTEQYTAGDGNFSDDLSWHLRNLIIGAPRNWSKNVIEWNLASDPNYEPHTPGGCDSCKGALTIGSSITRNVSYYIIASASKFVRPGSKRVASNVVGSLPNVAFLTPAGKKVLIVLNDGDQKQSFDIKLKGQSVTTSLESGAVGTYVWE